MDRPAISTHHEEDNDFPDMSEEELQSLVPPEPYVPMTAEERRQALPNMIAQLSETRDSTARDLAKRLKEAEDSLSLSSEELRNVNEQVETLKSLNETLRSLVPEMRVTGEATESSAEYLLVADFKGLEEYELPPAPPRWHYGDGSTEYRVWQPPESEGMSQIL